MLDGRIAIITGGGRGIGREHALLFASLGAKVVVNDLGGVTDGSGAEDRWEVHDLAKAMGTLPRQVQVNCQMHKLAEAAVGEGA